MADVGPRRRYQQRNVMARARLLKPGFFSNELLAEVAPYGRLLFAGLWQLADREGRLPDRPMWIKGAVFPYEKVAVDRLLDDLSNRKFIVRYEVEGERFIEVVNFKKHQHVHVKEGASTIPAPVLHRTSTIPAPVLHRTSPVISSASPAEAEADTEAVIKAEAVTRPRFEPKFITDPPVPDEPGFVGEYVRHENAKGLTPSAAAIGAAAEIERTYGTDACVEVAKDLGWEKHPNYLRPILEDRKNGRTQAPKRVFAGSNQGSARPGTTDILAGWEAYARGE